MRPGSLIAAGCLALLSVWRFEEGATGLAVLFAALALLNLGLAVRGTHRSAAPPPAALPPSADLQRARAIHQARRRGWLRIAILGWVMAIAGAFFFPPLSLVLATLSLYATWALRRSTRSIQILEHMDIPAEPA